MITNINVERWERAYIAFLTECYMLSVPAVNFMKVLKNNTELFDYKNYYLDENTQLKIRNKIAKIFNLTGVQLNSYTFNCSLGCSPIGNKENWIKNITNGEGNKPKRN